jgi:thiamine pyrophosphokinase
VEGVKYPVQNLKLTRWSTATLNVATGDKIRVHPVNGVVLVFQAYA